MTSIVCFLEINSYRDANDVVYSSWWRQWWSNQCQRYIYPVQFVKKSLLCTLKLLSDRFTGHKYVNVFLTWRCLRRLYTPNGSRRSQTHHSLLRHLVLFIWISSSGQNLFLVNVLILWQEAHWWTHDLRQEGGWVIMSTVNPDLSHSSSNMVRKGNKKTH